MKITPIAAAFAATLTLAVPANAAMAGTVYKAVNSFQSGQATKGSQMTVDAKGPVDITDAIDLPGFALQVCDVDFTESRLTMTLVAQLEKLVITQYEATTFDRYYFEFDTAIALVELSDQTDENFFRARGTYRPCNNDHDGRRFRRWLSV